MAETLMIRCPACGATNRVPSEKVEQESEPVCGRCKTDLPVGAQTVGVQPLTVTDPTFAIEVEQSPLPVLLDLWAAWCAPCRMMEPVINELAAEMAGRVKVAKLNVDDNPVTARRFKVWSIPTLLVLKGGQEVDRIVGVQPKSEIARRVQQALAANAAASPAA
jgi:thioredoxin 2